MDNIELDFLLMMIEQTRSGDIRQRVQALNAGEFDDDLKLALNRARRLRRWFERNAPSAIVRENELAQAAKGYDHFAHTDVRTDERFQRATSNVARLTVAYEIVDAARQEIEDYVEAVRSRMTAHTEGDQTVRS